MKDILIQYMENRLQSERKSKEDKKVSKAFITISREFGCKANDLATTLKDKLNKEASSSSWDIYNKELIEESAKELSLSTDQIKYVFESEKKTLIDEIINAMSSKTYKSDKKIRTTICNVIKEIGGQGSNILVGRGGVAICKDNPNAIHIKLIAPFTWRASKIANRYNISEADAIRKVLEMDEKRAKLIEGFMEKKIEESLFDIIYNVKNINFDEISDNIIQLLKERKMI
jgi:cytidylate kinase